MAFNRKEENSMTTHTQESSPLSVLVLPVLLAMIEGERTPNDIARQIGISISKVNSIIEELQSRRLVVEATPLVRDQFVEPQFRIADGEAVMEVLTNEVSENPIPYVLSILDAVRYDLPKAVLHGTKAYAWYSRLMLSPETAGRLVNQLVQMLKEFEEMQTSEASAGEGTAPRNHYRLSITFYQVGPEASHS